MLVQNRSVGLWGLVVLAVAGLGLAAPGRACDTPVYRYAMYRWLPAPYEVYHFYRDEMGAAAKAVKENLDQYRDPEKVPANVVFLPVDLNKDTELKSVPPDVKEKWLKQTDPQVPNYLISSPFGMHLHLGPLAEKDLEPLVDSPVRQQIGDELKKGNAGVFLLLPGKSQEANEKAEKLVKSVIADVNSGKVNLYFMPPMAVDPESDELDALRPKVSMVRFPRDDPKEAWFLRALLALEPDLPTVEDPILFLIYGRGRALFSCLGKGITRDILLQDIDFITGACSCTVKDQNPGIDLLMRYDWDSAAAHLARAVGPEEGNEFQAAASENVFPELIVPSGDGTEQPAASAPEQPATETEQTPAKDVAAQPPAPAEAPASDADMQPSAAGSDNADATDADAQSTAPDATPEPAGKDDSPDTADEQQTVALNPPEAPAESEVVTPAPSAFRSVLMVGIGLVGLLGVLFAATFFVLRPK